jgi:hypothetical protein
LIELPSVSLHFAQVLLSDMLLYAKRAAKGRLVVYKQVHRSLVQATSSELEPDSKGKAKNKGSSRSLGAGSVAPPPDVTSHHVTARHITSCGSPAQIS